MHNPDYANTRMYRGPIRGVVLDWSGTVADASVIEDVNARLVRGERP